MGLDFFRRAEWLGTERATGYLRLVALINIATIAYILLSSSNGVDSNGFLIGTDFLSFWTTGRMLHDHTNIYDVARHTAAQRTFFAHKGAHTAFFYPPTFLPFCWPLGFFSYFTALALWLATTGAAYLAAARAWLKKMPLGQPLILLFAAFPPVVIMFTHGQTTFLVAALLASGLLLIPLRPWLAGALLGLAVIKPQFGLLIPIVLLLTREWRVIFSAVLTAGLLAIVAAAAFGSQVWPDWYHVSSAAQSAMADGAVGFAKMQSPFAAARLLNAPLGLAYAVQGFVTLTLICAVAWASWGRQYKISLGTLVLAGAPLATPFVLDYDMVLLGFPLIWLAGNGFRPWEKLTFVLTFIAPAFARPLAMNVGVPIMPLVLTAFFIVVLRRVLEEKHIPAPT